jgi:hypothetical protein
VEQIARLGMVVIAGPRGSVVIEFWLFDTGAPAVAVSVGRIICLSLGAAFIPAGTARILSCSNHKYQSV